jgi:cysteine synthase A
MTLETDLIDLEIPVAYDETVRMMTTLMRMEGLAVGISSAANVVAACRYAASLPAGSRILTFAYDAVHDYLDAIEGGETNG